jgi:hypothetical protein
MDEFIALAEKVQIIRNNYRVNVHQDQPIRIDKNGGKWLKRGPMSVTVREGPLLEHAQKWFPDCNAVCLNRKRHTSPPMCRHRDGKNQLRESHICIWGDYPEGEGALVLEPDDGPVERITERGQWHTRAFSEILHHVEPHSSGTRFSAIAFKGKPVRLSSQFKKGVCKTNELD